MTINILQIIRGLDIGGDSGGAELFGIKVARELNKIPNCNVKICAFYSVGTQTEIEWQEKLNQEGIKTYFASEWGGYNNLNKFIKGLIKLISNTSKSDLHVCHSHFQLGTLAAVILKFLRLTKTAYRTAHIKREWNKGKWTWMLSPIFIKRIFPKYLNGEIGVSKAVCEYLINRREGKINKSKIHLIYNGIDLNQIKKMGRMPLSKDEVKLFEKPAYHIGCVGRLAEQKGYPYIIKAIEELVNNKQNVILYIVGDGELRTELEAMVLDLGLDNHINFLGLKNNVPALMRKWDLFVLPSLWEGFPTVVMEAMVSRVPIIATNIPGTNELIKDYVTGLLVPPRDSQTLKNKILEIKQNDQLRKLIIQRAAEEVVKFGMDNIAMNYYQLYQSEL